MVINKCTTHWERPKDGSQCDKINGKDICCKDCSKLSKCPSKCQAIYIVGNCGHAQKTEKLTLAAEANPLLEKAIQLATYYHQGQVDKGGQPYIIHPMTVMCSEHCIDDEDRIVAMLHDVIEDTEATAGALLEEGIPSHLVETIQLLTRDPKTDYMLYIRQIKKSGNERAIRVKMADLEHNGDLRRISNITQKDIKRVKKYNEALLYLKN